MTPIERHQRIGMLQAQASTARNVRLLSLFEREPQRVHSFTLEAAGLCLDISRQRLSMAQRLALLDYAVAAGVPARRDALLAGAVVNPTEHRPAWHTALRAPAGAGQPVEVAECLQRMTRFAAAVRGGEWRGERGEVLSDVICVGIGGSHLGPQLASEALAAHAAGGPRLHFLSNVDPAAWQTLQAQLDPHRSLAIIASKSWRTLETARNMDAVVAWFEAAGISRPGLSRHLAGVTAAPALATASGIAAESLFPFWDWVGGRYSLWSAIGLPLMLAVGPAGFQSMLTGAHAMDRHFAQAPLGENAPVALALVAFWNRLLDPAATEVVAPYCEPLRRLPSYLQQLQMESNGKSVDETGHALDWHTAAVTWGAAGTDAQHSFFQALHQGTAAHPVEFVLALPDRPDPQRRDEALLANAIAQAQALMLGRSREAVEHALRAAGMSEAQAAQAASHRVHAGDRPSTTLLIGRLTPQTLGALIALYEHKTAVLAWLWGINPFDQWGVELGKQMAGPIETALRAAREGDAGAAGAIADPATRAWVERLGAALQADDLIRSAAAPRPGD